MSTSHSHDFDFLFGSWRVLHRRLKQRLVNDNEWQSFEGSCTVQPLLGGLGNIDDNLLQLPGGSYRAASLRSFDPATRQWAIWWLDGRNPHQLDVPVVGGFDNGVGSFYAHDSHNGQPIVVRFSWLDTGTASPRWEQAFSVDGGASWEVNWTMVFVRSGLSQAPSDAAPTQ
jgi:hypothetical protein